MTTKKLTPLKAIRLKCLDCCAYQKGEIRLCQAVNCPLFPLRMGSKPKVSPLTEYTKKQHDLLIKSPKNSHIIPNISRAKLNINPEVS